MHDEEYFYTQKKDVYSIQSILASREINMQESIYFSSSTDLIRWPFNATNFFSTEANGEFEEGSEEANKYNSITAEIERINSEMKTLTNIKYDFSEQEKARELRAKKKELLGEIAELETKRKKSLQYKSVVEISDSKMVEKKLPFFNETKWPYKDQMPYFTSGLEDFALAVKNGEPTAIFGGPCFFEEYEVDMIFVMKDGSKKTFDFTTRRKTSGDNVSHESEFTKQNADEVVDVKFESHKDLLTTEEYDSILYLFELARVTNSAVTIPIPDFSYAKYLDAMIEPLEEEIQVRAHERFREVSKPIIKMYKDLVEFFKKQYPEVKCVLMSGEETELLKTYYEKRTSFVEKPSTKRTISGIQEKFESVKDYITLPALPLYLLGIKNVLEVDYLGETDSFWKCRKMHKGLLNLSALLYPIKISEDGWRTLFQTELKFKEYIKEEEYGKR